MPYDWKIEVDGVDITAKVARFEITADLAQYCREVTVTIADPAFYAALDFSTIPAAPSLEVFTKTADTWVSQGKYFIERPALSSDINQDVVDGLWGRGETARLGSPFAPRVSKMWDQDTSFFTICAEMCALAGLSWDDSQADIEDFYIFAHTYQVENAYPVDVLSELAELAGALLTCDRLGRVLIRAREYAPAAPAATIIDDDWQTISEAPEWPDFGNRVRIIPAGSLASLNIAVWVPEPCLPADGASRARVLARLTDPDGNPVDGAAVNWRLDALGATLAFAVTNTVEALMPVEEVRAQNRYEVALEYAPSQVLGLWLYADLARADNLLRYGYTLEDKTIVLARPLDFCDQLVRVAYMVGGVAVNDVIAGSVAEDITVTAEVGDGSAGAALYIGNDCRCPATLSMRANPSSIVIAGLSEVITCAEASGPVIDGRLAYNYERGALPLGALSWGTARLGRVQIRGERTAAANEVAGLSQCQVDHYIAAGGSVDVRRVDANGAAYGGNLYASHSGKRIDLTTQLTTGQDLAVTYTADGCARNWFRGDMAGTAYLKAWIKSNREAGIEAETSVRVTDPTDPLAGETPDDYTDAGGYGGSGGDTDGLEDLEYGCMTEDGSVTNCEGGDDWNTERVCCQSGGVAGCFPRQACDNYQPEGLCAPGNLSDNPDQDPAERFTAAQAIGCSCEQICRAELAIYGTTQTYDDASGRTIAEIVAQDRGIEEQEGGDNSAYWEAYNEIQADALQDCIDECNAAVFECAPGNPQVIGHHQTVTIGVRGGAPPYNWTVDGNFTLGNPQTLTPMNSLTAEDGACGGVSVTITDARAESITCTLRHTDGQWVPLGQPATKAECVTTGPKTAGTEDGWAERIDGRWKVYEERTIRLTCGSTAPYLESCTCGACPDNWYGFDGAACVDIDCIPHSPPYERVSEQCCKVDWVDGDTERRDVACNYIRYRENYEWQC